MNPNIYIQSLLPSATLRVSKRVQDDSETEAADDRSDSEEDSDTSDGEAAEKAPETPGVKETQTQAEEKSKAVVVAVEPVPTEVQPECGNENMPLVSDKPGSTHALSKDTQPAEVSKESEKASSNFVGIL